MVLHLSPPFKPFDAPPKEQIAFEAFTFSGGEPHIKLAATDLSGEHVRISTRLDSFEALGFLIMAVDALKRLGMVSFELFIPYFPGARQDRVMVQGEPLTAKVYADIINQLGAETVHILDPHSSVTPALLSYVHVIPNHDFIQQCLSQLSSDCMIAAPDAGASKKLIELATALGIDNDRLLFCSKKRDVRTGQLSGFEAHIDSLQGRDCLIVDDICDGGGTFLGLAEKLKEKQAGKLYLAVSHGIFSKGLETLTEQFESVFTTDSFQQKEDHLSLVMYSLDVRAFCKTPLRSPQTH